MIRFTIPGTARGKGRPRFGNGRTYTDAATINAEAWVRACAIPHCPAVPLEGPLAVRLDVGFIVPASWSRTKRAAALDGALRPTGRPDADNLIKLVCDPLNGLLWRDDSQVVELTVTKRYAEAPGSVLTVYELTAGQFGMVPA